MTSKDSGPLSNSSPEFAKIQSILRRVLQEDNPKELPDKDLLAIYPFLGNIKNNPVAYRLSLAFFRRLHLNTLSRVGPSSTVAQEDNDKERAEDDREVEKIFRLVQQWIANPITDAEWTKNIEEYRMWSSVQTCQSEYENWLNQIRRYGQTMLLAAEEGGRLVSLQDDIDDPHRKERATSRYKAYLSDILEQGRICENYLENLPISIQAAQWASSVRQGIHIISIKITERAEQANNDNLHMVLRESGNFLVDSADRFQLAIKTREDRMKKMSADTAKKQVQGGRPPSLAMFGLMSWVYWKNLDLAELARRLTAAGVEPPTRPSRPEEAPDMDPVQRWHDILRTEKRRFRLRRNLDPPR